MPLYIFEIQRKSALPIDGVSPAYLRPSAQAGANLVAAALAGAVARQIRGQQRARTNPTHLSLKHIPKLGQFIHAPGAQPPAERREAFFVGQRPPARIETIPHRAEFIQVKGRSFQPILVCRNSTGAVFWQQRPPQRPATAIAGTRPPAAIRSRTGLKISTAPASRDLQ